MTAIKTAPLLPCPFCGSSPKDNGHPNGIMGQIYCGSDDCFGPRTSAGLKEDSVKQWNTRAPQPAAALPEPSGLREALEPFAEFARKNTNENGWTSNIHRERISDWFGPSYFRAALAAHQPHAPLDGQARFSFSYKNHRGEIAMRTVSPIFVRFGSTEWHQEPQWLMRAFDHDKNAEREFAMVDMSQPPAQNAAERCATDAAYETLPTSGNACADCTAENCAYIRGGYGRCTERARQTCDALVAPVAAPLGGRDEINSALRAYFQSLFGIVQVSSDGVERVYCNGFPLNGLIDAILAAVTPTAPISDRAAALQSLEYWCTDERSKIGAVDGYDYRSGEEYGIRKVEIEIGKRIRALVAKGDA